MHSLSTRRNNLEEAVGEKCTKSSLLFPTFFMNMKDTTFATMEMQQEKQCAVLQIKVGRLKVRPATAAAGASLFCSFTYLHMHKRSRQFFSRGYGIISVMSPKKVLRIMGNICKW